MATVGTEAPQAAQTWVTLPALAERAVAAMLVRLMRLAISRIFRWVDRVGTPGFQTTVVLRRMRPLAAQVAVLVELAVVVAQPVVAETLELPRPLELAVFRDPAAPRELATTAPREPAARWEL